jgi:hypothetical protein
MKLSKQKEVMKTAIEKLRKSKDFGTDCKLDPDEAEVIYKLLTDTAIRIGNIQRE